jgi:hypothetical protein
MVVLSPIQAGTDEDGKTLGRGEMTGADFLLPKRPGGLV